MMTIKVLQFRNNFNIFCLLLLVLVGCRNNDTPAIVENEEGDYVTKVDYDWSLLTDKKDRYAVVALQEDEKRHLYYCANIDNALRPIITDYIVMRTGIKNNGNWQYGEEKVVVSPGDEVDAWDGLHACDPTIIGGEFWYQRPEQNQKEKFNYALFYLGIAKGIYFGPNRDIINQIGWAVAKSPEGPWYKVKGDTPLITSDAIGDWGVGQPSAISLDAKGDVLLFYTRSEYNKTATYSQRLDLSDANNPVLFGESELPINGLTQYDGSPDPTNQGGAFAYDNQTDRYYIIRYGHPSPSSCPNFISSLLQIASISRTGLESGTGEWAVERNLDGGGGFPARLFDGGWVRNKSGGLSDPKKLEVVVSTSDAGGACTDQWLYTYRIQGYVIPKSND